MLATLKLFDGTGSLASGLEVGDEKSSEIVPMIDRLIREVPEPRSCGFLEMQLDELHGGVTGAVIDLYRRQVILDPSLRILGSIVLVWLVRQLELFRYGSLPNGAGGAVEAESLVFFAPEGALISSAVDAPLGDVVARLVGSCRWSRKVTSRAATTLRGFASLR